MKYTIRTVIVVAMLAGVDGAVLADATTNHAAAGAITVSVDPANQQRLGLQVTQLTAGTAPREVMAFGRVLDAAPLAAQLDELDAAAVSAQLSRQELERVRQLHTESSDRRLQTAEAEARRDQLALQAARNRLRLTWGNAVAERSDLAELVQTLVAQTHSLVRLDLPMDANSAGLPTGVRLMPPASETAVAGTVLGMAPAVQQENQAQGILVLAPQGGVLLPGAAVTGFLEMPGPMLNGVMLPRSAVVRYSGRTWVYVQMDAGTFARREVTLENPRADGWLITRGFAPDDRIVASGAQLLLSEERKAEIQMDD